MSNEVVIYPKRAIDIDDVLATVNVLANTTGTKLVFNKLNSTSLRTRTGQKARLVFVGNAVDAGGESVVTFHVLINGTLLPSPYDSFQQALGVTYDPQSRNSVPLDLPQNALIEITADNSSATAYNAFARMRIEYESLN